MSELSNVFVKHIQHACKFLFCYEVQPNNLLKFIIFMFQTVVMNPFTHVIQCLFQIIQNMFCQSKSHCLVLKKSHDVHLYAKPDMQYQYFKDFLFWKQCTFHTFTLQPGPYYLLIKQLYLLTITEYALISDVFTKAGDKSMYFDSNFRYQAKK